MFALVNITDGLSVISRHRTMGAVAKANDKLQTAIKKNNGYSSYVPTSIRKIVKGKLVKLTDNEMDEYIEAGHQLLR